MTSKKGYLSTYQSPNIVIDLNSLTYTPFVKKMKINNKTVNKNLRILQDHQTPQIRTEMDPCLIKNEKEANLNTQIKNETCMNKPALANDLSKSNTVLMEDNNCFNTKLKNNNNRFNNNCKQTEVSQPNLTSVLSINSNSSVKNKDLNCKKQVFQDQPYGYITRDLSTDKYSNLEDNESNSLTSFIVKTEQNNNFYRYIDLSQIEDNSSNELSQKVTSQEDNKEIITQSITDKQKAIRNIIENNVKGTMKKPTIKKLKDSIEKNAAQVKKKYVTKVEKNNKNKSKTPKQIKITINVTYNNLHTKNNMKLSDTNLDGDLSFLDDFDVDEVVESLFNGREQNNSDLNTNIDVEGEIKENSKMKKMKNGDSLKEKHKESFMHHMSRCEHKIEPNKIETNLNVNNIPVGTESNCENNQDEENDSKNIPKILHGPLKKDELKQIKKDVNIEENKFMDMNIGNNKQNIGQGRLLNKFVTKSDRNLGLHLEKIMYDNLKQKYSVVAVTHYGKFSKIFKCTDMSGNYYAIKILDNPSSNHFKGKKKENILKELKKDIPEENLHFINLLHSFQIDNHMCYMTYYYSTNLEQLLTERKFHIDDIHHLAKQLVEAVTVLRNNNIVHHDIKPSHILVSDKADKLILCGFDEALYYIYSDNLKANIGTINYASPEKILGHSHGFSVDIWATALVIYEMATNSMLFPGTTDNEILFKQMSFFGNIPEYVIKESRFKSAHFHGTTFIKQGLNKESDIRINNFVKRNNIHTSILAAQSDEDRKKTVGMKLQSLSRLLERMLAMDPRKRLTIEYVYADRFFFDKIF